MSKVPDADDGPEAAPLLALRDLVPVSDDAVLDLPEFRDMYAFWRDRRGDRQLPPESAIDPLDFPRPLIPFLILLGVEENPRRFLVRLAGSAVTDESGARVNGRYVDTLPGTEEIAVRFSWCVDNALPYTITTPVSWSSRTYRTYSVLTLPFGDAAVTRLLQVFRFHHK